MFSMLHGTSYENAENILKEGFQDVEKTWYISNEEKAYFIDPSIIIKENPKEYENYAKEDALYYANEQGQITAAIQKSNFDSTIVLELIFEDFNFYKNFEPDSSCECSYSKEINLDILNQEIQKGKVKFKIWSFDFLSSGRILYLFGLKDNLENLTEGLDIYEMETIEELQRKGVYVESLIRPNYHLKTYWKGEN